MTLPAMPAVPALVIPRCNSALLRQLPLRQRVERRIIRPRYQNGAIDYLPCHGWQGGKSQSGWRAVWYPVLSWRGRMYRVNRLVLILEYGAQDVPAEPGEPFDNWFARALVYYRREEASHSCDDSECVNFTHLEWKGHAANIADQRARKQA